MMIQLESGVLFFPLVVVCRNCEPEPQSQLIWRHGGGDSSPLIRHFQVAVAK